MLVGHEKPANRSKNGLMQGPVADAEMIGDMARTVR